MDKDAAAKVARSRMGAPAVIGAYLWQEATVGGKPVRHVTFVNRANVTVRLDHTDVTTYGELRVGWDEKNRVAAWSWEPAREGGR